MTTLARLGLILEGEVVPCNWIEEAFARIVAAIGSVLPTVSDSDRGKFLGVNTSNNNLGWKAIRQVPDVENADKGKYLHANDDTGALEWSEAGGSGGMVSIATWTSYDSSYAYATLDIKCSDVDNAFANGTPIFVSFDNDNIPASFPAGVVNAIHNLDGVSYLGISATYAEGEYTTLVFYDSNQAAYEGADDGNLVYKLQYNWD